MRYLIIGNGAAGNAAAEAIRRRDGKGELLILSDESHPAYYRPLIPYLIHNGSGAQALFRDELHTPPGVTVSLATSVREVAPAKKKVALADGRELEYDRLLLATGSSPIFPSIPGLAGEGVWGLRRIDDAKAIAAAAGKAREAVVIGGGRIGTKAALALRHRGLQVSMVELLPRLIPAQLDEEAGYIFSAILEREGIKLFLGHQVKEVIRGGGLRRKGRLQGVRLEDGRELAAQLIVVAVGVRPSLELARKAGCALGQGVKVDKYLHTSLPDIYAAGDVVETVDLVTGQAMVSGTWTNAIAMGHCAGENMAGGKREYPGALSLYNAMEVAGHPVISAGLLFPTNGCEVNTRRWGDNYKKLVFRGDQLVGVLLVGEAVIGGVVYTTLIREGRGLGGLKEKLPEPGFGYGHFLHLPIPQSDNYLS